MRKPGFKGVPSYTRIEARCRRYGAIPKTQKELRAKLDQELRDLVVRKNLSECDRAAILDYLRGKFDRRREDGRPQDLDNQDWLNEATEIVLAVAKEKQCSRAKAIAIVFERDNIDDPEAKLFTKLLNHINRRKRPHE